MKTVKEILTENREVVVNYYNDNIKSYYNVTLKDFMIDLMDNFRKVTTSDDFRKMDVTCNLKEAQSRLGLMDTKIETAYSTPYAKSNYAKAVNYHGKNKVNTMANA